MTYFISHIFTMFFLKNKFIILIIVAILIGGVTGLYLSDIKKTVIIKSSESLTNTTISSWSTASGMSEVMKQLNDLTKE